MDMKVGTICKYAALSASVITLMTILKTLKKRKKRSVWTRPWTSRKDTTNSNAFRLLNDELKTEDLESCANFLRMNEETFNKLLLKVGPLICRKDTVMRESISAKRRLVVTLHFLATGESYGNLQYSHRIPKSTLSVIIPDVCKAIFQALKEEYMKVPSTPEEWKAVAEEFSSLWNFPNVLGAMDGRHVEFKPPRSSGSYYRNYKGSNSIVLIGITDAKYKFIAVDVGCNGRATDEEVYFNSNLSDAIENNKLNFPPPCCLPNSDKVVPYVFLADGTFFLQTTVMKPYNNRSCQNMENKIFNYRLSRARRVVENAFGILTNKFRIFFTKIILPVETVQSITMAACALHNFLITESASSYLTSIDIEDTDNYTYKEGDWRQNFNLRGISQQKGSRTDKESYKIRDTLRSYFNSEGLVPWQWEAVEKFNF